MRVIKLYDLPEETMNSATPIPGWTGGPVTRTRQAVIGDGDSNIDSSSFSSSNSSSPFKSEYNRWIVVITTLLADVIAFCVSR